MAVKCSQCGTKAGTFTVGAYQCNSCGTILCNKCAKTFSKGGISNPKKTVCPRCSNLGFSRAG